jgi:hypothetical protein
MGKYQSRSNFPKSLNFTRIATFLMGEVSNNGGFRVFVCKQLHEIFGFPEKGKALL